MRIAVIDGQGGGIGRSIVARLKSEITASEIIALGTNSAATAAMLKAGADKGATGENAIIYNSSRSDIIIGAMGIIASGSMLGEISEKMAGAIACSDAHKILIPLGMCDLEVCGVDEDISVQQLIDNAVRKAVKLIDDNLKD